MPDVNMHDSLLPNVNTTNCVLHSLYVTLPTRPIGILLYDRMSTIKIYFGKVPYLLRPHTNRYSKSTFYWCRLYASAHGLLFVDDLFISFARSVVSSLSPKAYPSETRQACLDCLRFGISCMRWRNLVDTPVFGFV